MERFQTELSGYSKEEVNRFVMDVTKEYESLLNKLKNSDAKCIELEKELQHYRQLENTLNRAISIAEEANHNIKKSHKNSEKIIYLTYAQCLLLGMVRSGYFFLNN